MINLDERYLSYLDGSKKMRIDGMEERVKSYGWYCEDGDIKGHYVTTQNHKLYYNMKQEFVRKESLRELQATSQK